MAYLNKVMLIGNVGKDPTFSATQGGKKRIAFPLATSRRYRDNNGEQKEDTQWHNIVGWGKIPDVMEQLGVRKGTTLYVEGMVVNHGYNDRATGQQKYITEIIVDNFQLLTPRSQGQQQSQQAQEPEGDAYDAKYDDGLPF